MHPDQPLPITGDFASPEQYVDELLDFVTTSPLLTTLCGGVHVLDFFTRQPDIYEETFPKPWRDFFREEDIMDLLDLFTRQDLKNVGDREWRSGTRPPEDLIEYIASIRRFLLDRDFTPGAKQVKLARDVALGMKVKKSHEVGHFATFIDELAGSIEPDSNGRPITHLIDLGSGQGYLSRTLASAPYHRSVIGLESRQNNIDGSKVFDVMAGLAPKQRNKVNKKALRAAGTLNVWSQPEDGTSKQDVRGGRGYFYHPGAPDESLAPEAEDVHVSTIGRGSIQYISHYLQNGSLDRVVRQIVLPSALTQCTTLDRPMTQAESNALPRCPTTDVSAMVIALHSCGNLLHHGLRSLVETPSVRAVAMVGCCYNLLTERLGPPSVKLSHQLRTPNTRRDNVERACDPHGFPMSRRYCTYVTRTTGEVGVRLNITARMMAVQAPQNWSREDSALFFRRHFYRALLQRVFVDLGLIGAPPCVTRDGTEAAGASRTATTTAAAAPAEPEGSGDTDPVILGSLPRSAYASFTTYVRMATAKLARHAAVDPTTLHPSMSQSRGGLFAERLGQLTDEQLEGYEEGFAHRKKELSVTWSLMAFSAGVIEAAIVVDRWSWLREQEEVDRAWVRSVFGYGLSPRNLVVVGVRKGSREM